MNRRGFITGLGALLGTTALVRPQLPQIEPFSAEELWADIAKEYPSYSGGPVFKGEIGRWLGITFVENDELRFERIEPSDFYE